MLLKRSRLNLSTSCGSLRSLKDSRPTTKKGANILMRPINCHFYHTLKSTLMTTFTSKALTTCTQGHPLGGPKGKGVTGQLPGPGPALLHTNLSAITPTLVPGQELPSLGRVGVGCWAGEAMGGGMHSQQEELRGSVTQALKGFSGWGPGSWSPGTPDEGSKGTGAHREESRSTRAHCEGSWGTNDPGEGSKNTGAPLRA